MSAPLHPAYRFATEAQWQACHFVGADRRTVHAHTGLRPFTPFGLPPTPLWTGAAYAPAVGDDSELFWRNDSGNLLRLPYEQVANETATTAVLASTKRLVAGVEILWAIGADGSVQAFDNESLARLFKAGLGDHFAIDIASDSSDGVYVLTRSNCRMHVVHLGCAGTAEDEMALDDVRAASALVFLGMSNRLVVLGSNGSKLYSINAHSGQLERMVQLSALRSCFKITAIGSDRCSRLFIAGTDREARGGGHHILIVDADGNLLGTVPVDVEVTGIAATRSQLFLTTKVGVLRFDPATTVPQGAGEVKALVVTPQLESSAKGPQKWMRVEANVELPAGCSIHISHALASNADNRAKAEAAMADAALSQAQRLTEWRRHVELRTFAYHGDSRASGKVVLSAPLHDVRDQSIWIEVALIAAPGGRLPVLSELAILYPGSTLIEHLPAIYRTSELESGDFTRALVGVLEASTQNLDQEIGKLGRKIHPKSADGDWLDYVASWLGLPWDNALSVDQKRRIISRAAAIAEGYSTRAGLEELLECLMPGHPRQFRVVDITAEYGLATIAGRGCEGSSLPAVLAGLPTTATELGNKAILGKARLPCGDDEPDSARLIGSVRIDVSATAEERGLWSPWLGNLIEMMLPAAVRANVRWLGPSELRGNRIDKELKIIPEPTAHLGSDAVTGVSLLGGRSRTTLPSKLTPNSTLQ